MTKQNKHTFYNFQFKHTAVRVANHNEIQANLVADALGVHPVMIYRWQKDMKDGNLIDNENEARSKSSLDEAKRKIRKLEQENRRLRDENIVLKKAERMFPKKK